MESCSRCKEVADKRAKELRNIKGKKQDIRLRIVKEARKSDMSANKISGMAQLFERLHVDETELKRVDNMYGTDQMFAERIAREIQSEFTITKRVGYIGEEIAEEYVGEAELVRVIKRCLG